VIRRQRPRDRGDRVDEAHLEHPVGFVEHERADARNIEPFALHVVVDAPRRADDDIDTVGQRRALSLYRTSAAEREHPRVRERAREPAQLLGHLRRELTRRAQHEGARMPAARRDSRQQREPERGRLAGAGRGLPEHVTAVQHRRQRERLDRRHLDVSELCQVLEPCRREGERRERERRRARYVARASRRSRLAERLVSLGKATLVAAR
jgi:hypothetical protein